MSGATRASSFTPGNRWPSAQADIALSAANKFNFVPGCNHDRSMSSHRVTSSNQQPRTQSVRVPRTPHQPDVRGRGGNDVGGGEAKRCGGRETMRPGVGGELILGDFFPGGSRKRENKFVPRRFRSS